MTASTKAMELTQEAAAAADDAKAEQIIALDVSDRLYLTDVFLLAAADNERQVAAVAEKIEDALREKHGVKPLRTEGRSEGRWILMDFGDIVVHVQHSEDRQYYALEKLWSDCPAVPVVLAESA